MTDVIEPWVTSLSVIDSQMLTFPWGYSETHSHSLHPVFPDPGSVLTDRLLMSPPQLCSSGLACKAFTFWGLLALPCSCLEWGPFKMVHHGQWNSSLDPPPAKLQIAPIEELLCLFWGQLQSPASVPYQTLRVGSQAAPRILFTKFLFSSSLGWSYEFLQPWKHPALGWSWCPKVNPLKFCFLQPQTRVGSKLPREREA